MKSDVDDFRHNMKLRLQLDPLFAESNMSRANPSDRDIIEFLVNDKIILLNFPVPDDEIDSEIRAIETKNRINRSTLQSALAQQGFDFGSYTKLIRSSIAKRKLIDRDVRTKVYVSDDDVRNYFIAHMGAAKKTSYSYVIKAVLTPDLDAARRAEEEIKAGHSFEEVAKKYSQSPSAATGGELGKFSESEMSPIIREQIKQMKQGQVSPIIGSKDTNFMILKLAEIRTEMDTEFNSRKEEIRNQLAAQEFKRQIDLWVTRKRQEAFVNVLYRD